MEAKMTVSEAIQTLRVVEGTWAALRLLGDALVVAQDADTLRVKAEQAASSAQEQEQAWKARAATAETAYERQRDRSKQDMADQMGALMATYAARKLQIDADVSAKTERANTLSTELLGRVEDLKRHLGELTGEKEKLEQAVARLRTTFEALKHQAQEIEVS